MSSHCQIQQRLPNWLAWKINASLNSIFVFVWYLENTGANPAWWQMFNWCSHMTIWLEKKWGSGSKSISLDLKWLLFSCATKMEWAFRCHLWRLEKKKNSVSPCHKQEIHTHQLSNIRHWNTVCKSYYWTRSNITLDGLHSCPFQSVWVTFCGREVSVAARLTLPRWVPAMSCEQAALAVLASSLPLLWNLPDTSTKAREQVALSRRISLQFCSLQSCNGGKKLTIT